MTDSAHKRIFMSYSRKDGAGTAATLRKDIEAQNLPVWQDIVAMEGGRYWASQIEAVLKTRNLEHFVLVVTPAALASPIVRWEIRLARQEGKMVSPVRGQGLGDLNKLPHWLGHIYDLDIPEQRAKLMSVLAGPRKQARVPMMVPEPPADFVQRPHEFGALKAKLLNPQGDAVAITAALRGAGGYGKTTLAKALAHDPDIADAYFDGILWVELGEKPGNLLSILSDLIETMTGERPGLENLNAAAAKLGEALGDRRILLIIDDAWREQDLRAFLQGGRNTTRLVTTRRDDILPLKAERQPVDAMQGGEALELLAWGLPQDQAAAQTRPLQALAARLGEWAQLLKLVNGFLRDRVGKARQPLDQAIAGVNKRLDEKGLDAFSARDEADRSKAIAKTISVSLDLLSDAERARFAELAVFPEDVDVPVGIAALLWAQTGGLDEVDTEDLLSRLEGLSLLLSLDLEHRSFRFHDTVRHFLQDRAGKEALAALHERLLEVMEGTEAGRDDASKRYYFLHRPAHIAAAGDRAALDALLLDPGWLRAKLDAVGTPQALIADYDQFSHGSMHTLIGRTLRLIGGICVRDRRQLLPQLLGRLIACEDPAAPAFLLQCRRLIKPPALVAHRASLTTPGSEIARLEGHDRSVNALALLPDGRLASGSGDHTIRLWDVPSGAEVTRLAGHTGSVTALVVLPDGRLASGSNDATIRLWDTMGGAETAQLVGHTDPVTAMVVLPDGRLASGSNDATVRLWNAVSDSHENVRTWNVGAKVLALAVLPDGRLVSGSDSFDGHLRLWDLKGEQDVLRLDTRHDGVPALAVSPGGALVSGSNFPMYIAEENPGSFEVNIKIWDVEDCKLIGRLSDVNGLALAFLANGTFVSGSSDGVIRVWDWESRSSVSQLKGHTAGVNALCALPDGSLASGSEDSTIRIWDVARASVTQRSGGHSGRINALAVLSEGRLASASGDGTVRLWDIASGAETGRLLSGGDWVYSLAQLSGGRLASGDYSGAINVWDQTSNRKILRIAAHGGRVQALCALQCGYLVSASGDSDGSVKIWDEVSGAEVACLKGKHGHVVSLAPLSGAVFVSGSDDGSLQVWDANKCTEIKWLAGHQERVTAVAILPDGGLASASIDGTIRRWDIQRAAEKNRLGDHLGWVDALAVLPRNRLASGSSDKSVRVWDLKDGAEICRFEVDAPVSALAAIPGSQWLVAGDAFGALHWLEIAE